MNIENNKRGIDTKILLNGPELFGRVSASESGGVLRRLLLGDTCMIVFGP